MNNTTYGYPTPYSYPYPQFSPTSYMPKYRSEQVHPMESMAPPKSLMYVTKVEPKLIEHLMMHKGLELCIVTTVGKILGKLDDVFIDHIAVISNGKKLHLRLKEIVYFEKA